MLPRLVEGVEPADLKDGDIVRAVLMSVDKSLEGNVVSLVSYDGGIVFSMKDGRLVGFDKDGNQNVDQKLQALRVGHVKMHMITITTITIQEAVAQRQIAAAIPYVTRIPIQTNKGACVFVCVCVCLFL
jgi:hypothetical protein